MIVSLTVVMFILRENKDIKNQGNIFIMAPFGNVLRRHFERIPV